MKLTSAYEQVHDVPQDTCVSVTPHDTQMSGKFIIEENAKAFPSSKKSATQALATPNRHTFFRIQHGFR